MIVCGRRKMYCLSGIFCVKLIFAIFAYLIGFAKIKNVKISSTQHKFSSLLCFFQIGPLITKLQILTISVRSDITHTR